jgi:biotin synthase
MLDTTLSVNSIIEKAAASEKLTRAECTWLFSLDERSAEAGEVRSACSTLWRKKKKNSAMILAQIGIDVKPCPADCEFCSFGEGHTSFKPTYMDESEVAARTKNLAQHNDLYGLFLMAMHTYDLDRYLRIVEVAKRALQEAGSPSTQIWANVGDTDRSAFEEMKAAGVSGVYHVCRLGEGKYTKLEPTERIKTMHTVLEAGLQLYTCLEPVGPEQSPEELTENLFIGLELPVLQHAAMRRVAVPGSPLARYGQISNLRLSQLVATVGLAALGNPSIQWLGVHEPHEGSCFAGANSIFAESGVNPRDTAADTAMNRGFDMARCRKLLWESGYTSLTRTDGSSINLDYEYLVKTDSLT